MKQNNLFMAILTAMLLLSVGAKAQISSVTVNVGNASYECSYDGTPSTRIHPLRAVLVRYSSTATATSFEMPAQVSATIGLNQFFFNVEGITGWTSGTTSTVYHGAFENNTHLESIRIPATVGIIGEKSFCNSHLTKVVFSGTPNLATIGPSAFKGCSQLNDITIPASVTTIGASAFEGCTSLNRAELPSNLTTLGRAAFKGCTSLYDYSFGGLTSIPESAYEGCTSIGYLGLPYDLTSVGANAFKGCTGLTTVELYATMQNIAPTAFADCNPDDVTYTIKPSDNVTTVADGLMQNCECVGKVVLADGITAVGSDAFNGCNVLCRLELTTSVRSIVSDAFNVTSNFRVDVNSSQGEHKDIANRLFFNVSSLTAVNINSGVTAVGERAFEQCSDLKSINIENSDSELSIGVCAFSSCTSLKVVPFPKNVSSIGEGAFQGCSALENIRLFITTSVWSNSFSAAHGDVALPTLAISSDGNNFSVPDRYLGDLQGISKVVVDEGFTSIGELSFHGMTSLQSVELPTTLESIGNYAFQACSSLTSVDIPANVTAIGAGAFSDCPMTDVTVHWADPITPGADPFSGDLSAITLHVPSGTMSAYQSNTYWHQFLIREPPIVFADDNVKAVCVAQETGWDTNNDGELSEDEAAAVESLGVVFKGNTEIQKFQELRYFTGLTRIAESAFEGCTSLEIVQLPSSVTSIGERAFYGCSNLAGISGGYAFRIPDEVVSVGKEAFANCKPTKNIEIFGPAVIEEKAFEGSLINSDESHVYITSALNSIADDAFEVTNALFTIGNNNEPAINANLFSGCTFLKRISVSVPIGDGAFRRCTNLRSVFLSDGVTAIGQLAFQDCSSIESVELPSALQTVEVGAFGECTALSMLIIPDQVTNIEQYAFTGCTSLQTIIVKATTPPTAGAQSFANYSATLFVPEESAQAYATTAPWSNFQNWGVIDSQGIRYSYAMVNDSPKATVVGYMGWANDLAIAGSIKGHDGRTYPVKEINTFELARNNYQSIVIPASITTIQVWAFAESPRLKTVKVGWTDPTSLAIIPRIFNFTPINPNPDDSANLEGEGILYVPAGTTALYQETLPWSLFKTFIEYQLGDANGDGPIDINDVLAIVDYILGNAPANFDVMAADANGDGGVSIADAAVVLNIILSGNQ